MKNTHPRTGFSVENNRLVAYFDGCLSDNLALKSRLILYYLLKDTRVQSEFVTVDKYFLETILEIDFFVIRQFLHAQLGADYEYEDIPSLFEYIPQVLTEINSVYPRPVKLDENLILDILLAADRAVVDSFLF